MKNEIPSIHAACGLEGRRCNRCNAARQPWQIWRPWQSNSCMFLNLKAYRGFESHSRLLSVLTDIFSAHSDAEHLFLERIAFAFPLTVDGESLTSF